MKPKRFYLLLVGLIIIIFVLPSSLTAKMREQTHTVLAVVTTPLSKSSFWLRKVVLVARDLHDLPAENEQLQTEVSRLLAENGRLKEVDHENAVLKDQLKLEQNEPAIHYVAARVIARSAYSFQNTVTLNQGSIEGIQVGNAVTSNGNLLGRVTAAADHTSDVELITSGNAITQAELQNSRVTGVVKGGLLGLTLDDIPQDVAIAEGEMVVTSGLGGNLRPGILIGTVLRVTSTKNHIFQSATLKPAANIDRIDMMFVEVK